MGAMDTTIVVASSTGSIIKSRERERDRGRRKSEKICHHQHCCRCRKNVYGGRKKIIKGREKFCVAGGWKGKKCYLLHSYHHIEMCCRCQLSCVISSSYLTHKSNELSEP